MAKVTQFYYLGYGKDRPVKIVKDALPVAINDLRALREDAELVGRLPDMAQTYRGLIQHHTDSKTLSDVKSILEIGNAGVGLSNAAISIGWRDVANLEWLERKATWLHKTISEIDLWIGQASAWLATNPVDAPKVLILADELPKAAPPALTVVPDLQDEDVADVEAADAISNGTV